MTTYTPSGYGAIALGALCFSGTAAFLLRDIAHTGPTLEHGLAIIALIITIGAGVMAVNSVRHSLVEAAVLAVIAALGSYYCLSSAAGRSAEAQQTATLRAESSNGPRQRAQAAYDTAVDELAKAKTALKAKRDAKECSVCKAEKAAVDDAQTAVDAAEAKLGAAPAPVPVNVTNDNLASLAKLIPAVTADKARIVEALNLVNPNVVAVLLELGDIVFWHIGLTRLARRRLTRAADAAARRQLAAPDDLPPPALLPAPGGRLPAGESPGAINQELPAHRRQREAREKVVSFVEAYRREHGREPEPREVRAATGLPRATAWRYQRAAV